MRDTSRLRGAAVRAAAALAMALGTLGIAAAPSNAVGECAIGNNVNGPIGVTQTLSVVDCNNIGVVTVTYSGSITTQQLPVYPGPGDNGLATWVPNAVGTATLSMAGTPYATSVISQVPTTSVVTTPNTATLGQATQIKVIVQAASPSAYTPTGQVVVRNVNGAVLHTMGLTAGPGLGQSYGYYWWTPTVAGTYTFQATYSGDVNATSSTSPLDTIVATASGNTIVLSAPATMTQGVPVQLTATVYPAGVSGTVGFTINGSPISGAIPIVNGQSSLLWTPNVVGQVTLGASYTTNAGGSGSTSEKVTIVAGPVSKDVITLTQPGYGTWAPNGTYSLGNGSNFAFQATTLSGAAVTLSENGPCQVSGLTLVVDTGSGQCQLTASSNGGAGYAAVRQNYTVNTVPGQQSAKLAAPQSGNINKGKTITLEKASQGTTNAGQPISWKITAGKGKVCSLSFPSNGSVKLKMKAKGTCTVKATAPAVPNAWAKFLTTRTYRGV